MDMIVSILLYFASTFYPAQADMIKFLIGAIQPVAIILIAAFAVEDVANISATATKYLADQSTRQAQLYRGIVPGDGCSIPVAKPQ